MSWAPGVSAGGTAGCGYRSAPGLSAISWATSSGPGIVALSGVPAAGPCGADAPPAGGTGAVGGGAGGFVVGVLARGVNGGRVRVGSGGGGAGGRGARGGGRRGRQGDRSGGGARVAPGA